jgi:cellulase/cellobiase CelA1
VACLGHDGAVPRRHAPTRLLAPSLVAVTLALTTLVGCSGSDEEPAGARRTGDPAATNPYADRAGYADPGSRTAQAAARAKSEGDAEAERIFTRLVDDAVTRLDKAGVSTYLDGGHSNWIEPDQLAPLLRRAGIGRARGFATNVSNYQTDDDERAYAEQLSGLLDGAHYIIDTGRNGNGSTDDWCNPSGRAYGTDPAPAPEGDAEHLDASVWVKPPGESDGECGGGPAAGRFWPERALEMSVSSGW